jgi:hypothetical protein
LILFRLLLRIDRPERWSPLKTIKTIKKTAKHFLIVYWYCFSFSPWGLN